MSPTAKITKSDLGWKTLSKDKFLSNLKFDKIFSSDIGGQAQARENRERFEMCHFSDGQDYLDKRNEIY